MHDLHEKVDKLLEVALAHDEEINKFLEAIPPLKEELRNHALELVTKASGENKDELAKLAHELSEKKRTELSASLESRMREVENSLRNFADTRYADILRERQKAITIDEVRPEIEKKLSAEIPTLVADALKSLPDEVRKLAKKELAAADPAALFASTELFAIDKAYKRGALVALRGSTYVVLKPTRGVYPENKNTAGSSDDPTFLLIASPGAPGVPGPQGQPFDPSAVVGNGILTKVDANTTAVRTITAGSANIAVTNGDGVSGNPVVNLASVITVSAVAATSSAGLQIKSNNGTLIATMGSGGGSSVTFEGGVTSSSCSATTGTFTNAAVTVMTVGSSLAVGSTNIASSTNSRRSAQAWVFDGTAGASITLSNAIGTAVSFSLPVAVPSANPSSQVTVLCNYGSGLAPFDDGFIEIRTNGALRVNFRYSSVDHVLDIAGFVSSYGGKTVRVTVSAGGTNAFVFADGTQIGTYAVSPNLTGLNVGIGKNISSAFYTGTLGPVSIVNAALSATEVATLAETGRLPSWCHSAQVGQPAGVGLITGDNSTFASDTGFWTKNGSVTGWAGTVTCSSGGYISKASQLVVGQKYRVLITVSSLSTTIVTGSNSQVLATGTGTTVTDYTAVDTSFTVGPSAGGNAVIDTITLTPLGSVLNLDPDQPGSGYQWANTNRTGDAVAPASGVVWAIPNESAPFKVRTSHTASGTILASGYTVPAGNLITNIIARATTAVTNFRIGTAAGGFDVVATVNLTANTSTALTVASPMSGGASVEELFQAADAYNSGTVYLTIINQLYRTS